MKILFLVLLILATVYLSSALILRMGYRKLL